MKSDDEKTQRFSNFERGIRRRLYAFAGMETLGMSIFLVGNIFRLPVSVLCVEILVWLVSTVVGCRGILGWLHQNLEKVSDRETAERQDRYRAETMRIRAEMHALQSQINPHFLYNTLENIRALALSRDEMDIARVTEALSDMFRYSISRPKETATLQEELENVQNYIMIQKQRFLDKIHYYVNVEDEEAFLCRLPVLTLQPIMENAVSHGLEPKRGSGSICTHVFMTDYHVVIRIADDGVGMDERTLAELRKKLEGDTIDIERPGQHDLRGEGIALVNVDRRLKFYFGKEYGLNVMSTQGIGTVVEVTLPNYEAGGSPERTDLDR